MIAPTAHQDDSHHLHEQPIPSSTHSNGVGSSASNTHNNHSGGLKPSRPFFHSNTPGSAIDLTEMVSGISTPPSRHMELEETMNVSSNAWKGKRSNGEESGQPGQILEVTRNESGSEGLFREEVWSHGRERVDVEMGGLGDLAVLLRTIDFAAQKHSCQRRKDVDQTPYINHPIAVANFLTATGIQDVRVLQAAVLHDTVEDTHTTLEEISQIFGQDVARIVGECTDNPNLSGQQRKAEQVRTAPHKSKEAQMVKLADKLHNLESIRRSPPVGWGVRRIQAYFIWAKQVTDVCAGSHPRLAARLQHLYETAYTRVNGKYHPCHPGVCGPLTEEEKLHIDSRLSCLKDGETPCPKPIFF